MTIDKRQAFAFMLLAGIAMQGLAAEGGGLGGTSWQLVRFQGGDDTVLTPDDASKYTMAFDEGGRVSVRIDCNRGSGAWKSPAPGQLELGALAVTQAACPPAPLSDRLAKSWTYIRSYVLKDGHLFLSLMADGGTFELEPAPQRKPDAAGPAPAAVRGNATYRERMALPPGAVFEATLEDVSRAGAKAQVLGRARVEKPGNPPFAFEIAYDPSRIVQSHRYAVRGRILARGRLLFTTDRGYPVLTGGKGTEVELLLRRTGASGPAKTKFSPVENTYWKLVQLHGAAVTAAPNQREAHFILHPDSGRVSGSGGCNRLNGSYEVKGNALKFGQLAGTMMTCPQGMEVEQAFLKALQHARRWKRTGEELYLYDDKGVQLARLESRYMQ